jgi:FMN phosphatase YigB (HAD superfamily)
VPTLFCDLTGVVFADAPDRPVREWRAANGGALRISSLSQLRDDLYCGFELGQVEPAQYAGHLRAVLGWNGSDQDLVRIWNSARGALVLDVVETLSGLRDRGWQLVAVATIDPWSEQALQEQFDTVMSMFDRTVLSTRVRSRKPDPRFFAEMLRAVPRHGPQLYVDHDPQVVAAARRAGIDGHVFADAQGLKSACQSLLLAMT